MFSTGRLAQITREMNENKLHILGISECRWTGFGSQRTQGGETILFSGRNDNLHRQGVALILKRGVEKSLLEWKPINERLIRARFFGKQVKMTIIQCYAPTNDADPEQKDIFYETLQAEVENTPSQDLLIIMGDLNAMVGTVNTGSERVMGKHGYGNLNENGERLVELCGMNNLVIGGTLFPHKDIHKISWNSPNRRDQSQIDHLLINGKWRRSLQDVRVRRGADVGSDHHLVTAMVQLKLLRSRKTTCHQRRFDVSKLKNYDTRNQFCIELCNRFETLAEENTGTANEGSITSEWDKIVKIYHTAATSTLGYKQKSHKEWLSADTWDAIAERKRAKGKIMGARSTRLKEKLQAQYSKLNAKVKRSARADKRRFVENLATEAEAAAQKQEQGTVYRITKQICGGQRRGKAPICSKQGALLTTEKEQEERWAEHFQEVLNKEVPEEPAAAQDAEEDLDISIEPPTKEEIVEAIRDLKNGKAPGQDQLNAELFKCHPELAAEILLALFAKVWNGEGIPSDWSKGVIIPIPKKGTLSDCNNWRGITLLSLPSKIFCKVIVKRLSLAVNEVLRQEQAGFRKGRGCTEHIFSLRNIIEQCHEWQRGLYINFIDFQKAFDSVHRESLWSILRAYGIPAHIVQVIKQFYTDFCCSVGGSDLSFHVKSGVRQGCVMSALLFNIVIDWVLSRATEDRRRGIRWTLSTVLEDLDYADDIALLSHSFSDMQEKTDRLDRFSRQVGLKISPQKTKVLPVNISAPLPIKVGQLDLETTQQFTYLGSTVCSDGGADIDIRQRIGKARGAFAKLRPVWRSRNYSRRTKIKIYQACVLSVLLYGSECWRMTVHDLRKLQSFHTSCLRKILHIFWPKKISNNELFKLTEQEDMSIVLTRKRWSWVGHVLRRETTSISKVALRWTPEGKRKRGRPKSSWRRTAEAELQALNLTWGQASRLAKDRQEWRQIVDALCATRRLKD